MALSSTLFGHTHALVYSWRFPWCIQNKRNSYQYLTGFVSIKFSPQRDVTSPTHGMNADKACSDSGRKTVSYNRVSIAISTECLKIKIKTSTKIDLKELNRRR